MNVKPTDSRVPGGVRIFTNLLKKEGWTLTRLTYSMGPRINAKGEVQSISDRIVLNAMGHDHRGVAMTWTDGKFDTAWLVERTSLLAGPVTSTKAKSWIKGEPLTPPTKTDEIMP